MDPAILMAKIPVCTLDWGLGQAILTERVAYILSSILMVASRHFMWVLSFIPRSLHSSVPLF